MGIYPDKPRLRARKWVGGGARGCARTRVYARYARVRGARVRDARGVMLSARRGARVSVIGLRALMRFIVCYQRLRLAGKNNLFIYHRLRPRRYHYTVLVG